MLLFPRMTQLDLTGPYEVLARLPNTKVESGCAHARAGDHRPRHADRADRDLCRLPAARRHHGAGRGRPAGPHGRRGGAGFPAQSRGVGEIRDLRVHRLAGAGRRRPAQGQARHQPLGAVDHLALLGAIPTHERVVVDGNIVTGAGVVSGIDFALRACGHSRRRAGRARDAIADRIRSRSAVRLRLAQDARRPTCSND